MSGGFTSCLRLDAATYSITQYLGEQSAARLVYASVGFRQGFQEHVRRHLADFHSLVRDECDKKLEADDDADGAETRTNAPTRTLRPHGWKVAMERVTRAS